MIKYFLALLIAFFRPQVDEPPPDDQPPPDDEPPPEDSPPREDAAPPEDDQTPPQEPPPDQHDADTAAENARLRADAERYQRELANIQARQTPAAVHPEIAREDAVLADPNASALEKWQVQANRALRQGTSAAQTALWQAADTNDRTSFMNICIRDPIAKTYETRVEQELAKARQAGGNASREAIYTFLLGRDMRQGKFKRAGTKPTTGTTNRVPRGTLPSARSDVKSNGKNLTDHQKRIERLRDVQI